jgi:hypothetical protein
VRDGALPAAARDAAGGRVGCFGGEGNLQAQEETALRGDSRAEEALWGQKGERSGHRRLPKTNLTAQKSSQLDSTTNKNRDAPWPMSGLDILAISRANRRRCRFEDEPEALRLPSTN